MLILTRSVKMYPFQCSKCDAMWVKGEQGVVYSSGSLTRGVHALRTLYREPVPQNRSPMEPQPGVMAKTTRLPLAGEWFRLGCL